MAEKRQPIQVVDRTLDLLELLAAENEPLPTTGIAQRLGISVQCANNLLRVLFRRGYVSQDRSRRYRLGPQLCIFGDATARWEFLRKKMEPVLVELNRRSGFGAFAGVLENDRLYCCAHIQSDGGSAPLTCQRWTEELHSTAGGRVLLAALSPVERKKLFARTTRRKLTRKTVMDEAELEKICRKVRKDGYAEVKGESRVGICSMSVPVFDPEGTVIAGLGIYGPVSAWKKSSLGQKKALLESVRAQLEDR
ncbi:MAG: IclR family transcriptional regulator [Lentisphaeria bacterium]|nr:IclR family transcriptional regulator [Lentisphaeria bacterium]